MTKLKLKVMDRLGIIRTLNRIHSQQGLDIMGLKRSSEIIEKCELDEGEKKKVNWIDIKGGGANINLVEANKLEREIEFSKDEVEIIKTSILAMDKLKGFSGSDVFVIKLCELLKIDVS